MEGFIIYLIKLNITISIIFLFYYSFLRMEKFLKVNRFILLVILLSSFVLPLTPAINFFRIEQIQDQHPVVKPLAVFYNRISKSENVVSLYYNKLAGYHSNHLGVSVIGILFLVYIAFVSIRFLLFSFQLLNLYAAIRNSKKHLKGGIVYCEHETELPPFSFFNYFVFNKSVFSQQQLEQIKAHETAHIQQWHSVDILLSELAQILLWINPLVLILKKQINLNLEYIADAAVLEKGVNKKEYQSNILRTSLYSNNYPLANLFNSSKLKLRIKMMNAKKASGSKLLKYAFLLPLVFGSYFIINPLSLQTLRAQVQKQFLPKQIDSIIIKCKNALIGVADLNTIKTLHLESTITLSNGITGSCIYTMVFGDSYRHETIIGSQKVILCESKTKGWKMNPRDVAGTELDKAEIAEYQVDIYPGGYLFNYAALGNKIELTGRENLKGMNIYRIKVSTKDSITISYFIDPDSYLIVKEIREYDFNGNSRKRVFEYSNFKKIVGGFLIPFNTEITNPQGITYSIAVTKADLNKEIDPGIFIMPKEK
jgi:hypothetical protein